MAKEIRPRTLSDDKNGNMLATSKEISLNAFDRMLVVD